MFNDAVRSYLLGTLPDNEANTLEERYFTDRVFFREVTGVETKLIQDYLTSRLSAGERRRFEARYLHVPELQKRLEEVRQTMPVPVSGRWWGVPRFALAGVVAAGVATGVWVYHVRQGQRSAEPVPMAKNELPAQANDPAFHLSPGVRMSGAGDSNRLVIPRSSPAVKLILELPGAAVGIEVEARLQAVQDDGQRRDVAKLSQSTEPARVTLPVSSSVLVAGDYVLSVRSADGKVQETYTFRIVR